jgi:hydroxymethylpyrimidine pyrophosphatase-like HAD family hydrolase
MGKHGNATTLLKNKRIRALATDGDGTLTTRKILARRTAQALNRWKAAGRMLVLTTGETIEELKDFPELERFDLIVAENGALLHWPSGRTKRLAPSPPIGFVRELRHRNIPELTIGATIVAVKRPHDAIVREIIQAHRLDWVISYNRRQVMALPAGIDKAFGLRHAVQELGLTCNEVASIGDAENDIPLLCCCAIGVAVSTAVAGLQRKADLVVEHGSGAGVVELIDRILDEDH